MKRIVIPTHTEPTIYTYTTPRDDLAARMDGLRPDSALIDAFAAWLIAAKGKGPAMIWAEILLKEVTK